MSARSAKSGSGRRELPLLAAELQGRRLLPCLHGLESGRFRIIDRDYVEPSNLQRQTLFDESDAENRYRAIAAAKKFLPSIPTLTWMQRLPISRRPTSSRS